MLIVARDRDYDVLLENVKGRKVHIWTCNTCARLCHGLGGRESAEKLAKKLREDGVTVTGPDSAAASCIESHIRAVIPADVDIIVALTCDIGAECARNIFRKEVLNPVRTFGPGIITNSGPVLVTFDDNGKATMKPLLEICGTGSPDTIPFV